MLLQIPVFTECTVFSMLRHMKMVRRAPCYWIDRRSKNRGEIGTAQSWKCCCRSDVVETVAKKVWVKITKTYFLIFLPWPIHFVCMGTMLLYRKPKLLRSTDLSYAGNWNKTTLNHSRTTHRYIVSIWLVAIYRVCMLNAIERTLGEWK